MPIYVTECEKCGRKLEEFTSTMAEREEMRCPSGACGGELQNDYSRMNTSNFQLTGLGWPGKVNKMENDILRDRHKD